MNKQILLAIPTYSPYIHYQCMESFYGIRKPDGYEIEVQFVCGYSAAQARNKACNQAIKRGFDYLLMIDADQIAPADTLEKLIACNSEVSCGWAMQCVNDNRTNISKYVAEKSWYDFFRIEELDSLPGIIEADAIGFACVMIKVSVFQKLEYPYFRYIEYGDGTCLSEDLQFSSSLRAKGIPIVVDKSLNLPHQKIISI